MAASTVCVVIDGANVACQKDGKPSIPLLAAAIDYFHSLAPSAFAAGGLKCVAFVPNFWLNVKPVNGGGGNGAMETDDWGLLKTLVEKDHVTLTPSQAHDDFYVIDYAVKHDGFIVTTDMFRDHVSNRRKFHGRTLTQNWVRSHCIDFTFVGREFCPNAPAMERVFRHRPDPKPLAAVSAASSAASAPKPRPKSARSLSGSAPMDQQAPRENEATAVEPVKSEMAAEDSQPARPKKAIDLSEVTYYKVPRTLLPELHGSDGETMRQFQEFTDTYIVLPSVASLENGPVTSVATLSIYGKEANRQQAVQTLDQFLSEKMQQIQLQQQQQHFYHQQQQQQLYIQQQQQMLLHQQHQQQFYYQHQHQQHQQFPPTATGHHPSAMPQDQSMMDVDHF